MTEVVTNEKDLRLAMTDLLERFPKASILIAYAIRIEEEKGSKISAMIQAIGPRALIASLTTAMRAVYKTFEEHGETDVLLILGPAMDRLMEYAEFDEPDSSIMNVANTIDELREKLK